MDYNFHEIENKWRKYWSENQTFKALNNSDKPKYYVLDMFPYPSGAGLHVGHPLGYIASDIYARYKRHKGFNVLHPMGYDAYGLPAEQYAIQTGQHPAVTTEKNIKRYREQLDKLGFSFDWSREVRTCDPKYYKWTQWTFLQLFKHWYNQKTNRAEPIAKLIEEFERKGNVCVYAASGDVPLFTADDWKAMDERQQQEILMNYRLAYLADTTVNWCPALGTVLANDEVVEGYSVRGGHPVEKKTMKQWLLRITAYSERLLAGLETLEWSESLKEIQRNWIGRSEGAMLKFPIKGHDLSMEIFTTRPDTVFGVTFMTFAPEHEYVLRITTAEQRNEVEQYIQEARNKTERERMSEVKKISGVFTGAYAINPFTGEEVPIWISDYVLAGYGTGAVMAVPGHDSRDWAFARHFGLPIKEVIQGGDITKEAFDSKDGIVINSGFINGMVAKDAIRAVIEEAERRGIGYGKVNYRLRDAIFSRQRYWGEPFPIYYKDGIPYPMDESELPLILPEIDKYLPTETGEPPLARAKNWVTKEGYPIECNTMPGFAGSSGYYLRYMDPHNDNEYFSKEANRYWENVDLYVGGAEHATGHLIYARFWNMFLYDIGLACKEEPFKKLINQGMIQGRSSIIYRIQGTNIFISKGYFDLITSSDLNKKALGFGLLRKKLETLLGQENAKNVLPQLYNTSNNHLIINQLRVNVNIVEDDILNIDSFNNDEICKNNYPNAIFITEGENDVYICGYEIEKMSKTFYNVINPDDIVEKYGADCLRMYEMFLGPIEMHKPWDTKGLEGVSRFLRKLWRLIHDKEHRFILNEEAPTAEELKILHKTIQKVTEDIERFSMNTAVSAFMICVNELTELKCNKRAIIEPLAVLISPFAPHIAEEIWSLYGNKGSIEYAPYPEFNPAFVQEDSFEYPVSFNGKLRFKLSLPLSATQQEIEAAVLANETSQKWLEGKAPKKIIVVPKKIINVVH